MKVLFAGAGAGVWSFVYIEEAAEATVAALEHGQRGIYNIVDDEPAPVVFPGRSRGMEAPVKPVTRMLSDWRQGRADALDELMPLVYEELRRLALRYLHRERPGHTLQATAPA